MNLYLLTNQARWHAIEDAANINGAVAADFRTQDFVVGDAAFGQQLQRRFLLLKLCLTLAIESGYRFINHRLVVSNAGEVTAATQVD